MKQSKPHMRWRKWFRQFLVYEWVSHILILTVFLAMFANRFDVTEFRTIAGMAGYTAVTGAMAYATFTHCLKHPKTLFRKYDRWMRLFLGFEYVFYLAGLFVALKLTATRFDQSEDLVMLFSAAANMLIMHRSWMVYQANKADPERMGTDHIKKKVEHA